MKMSKKHDQAFSGIEAAIVLIAFVVVASVFSYVMLGAGFFTTQKSQQIAHSEVTQTTSTIAIRGDVIGLDSFHGGNVSIVEFDIGLAEGGSPVDISRIRMSFSTPNQAPTGLTYIPSNGAAGTAGLRYGAWFVDDYLINHATRDYCAAGNPACNDWCYAPGTVTTERGFQHADRT